jgi:hypothetical protein
MFHWTFFSNSDGYCKLLGLYVTGFLVEFISEFDWDFFVNRERQEDIVILA